MIKNLFLYIIAIALFSSCKKENFNPADAENINGLGGDTWSKGQIDQWIYDTLTVPYNISIKYKWDQFEDLADITKILVPPKEEYIIPILSAARKVWINTYIAEANEGFFKKLCPKYFYLIGSPAFEQNGTIKLGVAEGGRKIILLAINYSKVKGMADYDPADSFWIKQMFHTIHHEFGHILHQNVLYPQDFKNLNSNLITSNWTDYTDRQALSDGFISAYAMNNSDDDFVETISIMLIEGKAGFENMIASIPPGITGRGTTREQAIARLRAKESIIVNYYKQVYNIDFYSLQSRVHSAVQSMIR
jgi:substrate import-associated zinc metallohydrolase lipoprotein